ncbi:hypothetical protein B0H13DRAFT_1858045 [Mycena leptocephala]|nr:hypothetical protein B0H13DRAFT_1858045 [Mycena leptocephala]
MTTRVHKLDATSPLIQYAGPWNLHINENYDTYASCDHNCSAALQFTGIQVLVATQCDGKKRDECKYATRLDDQSPHFYNQELVNVTPGLHTFNIFGKMNLDYFNWTSIVNSLNDTHIQDDAPDFVYDPPDAWSTNITGLDHGHTTTGTIARVTFTFAASVVQFRFPNTLTFLQGDRVALYGAVGVQGGDYTVQLDNEPFQNFTEYRNISSPITGSWLPDQLIFYADGLNPGGNHTVTLVSQSTSPQVFILNYAIVDGDFINDLASTPASSSTVPSQSSTNKPPLSSISSGHPRLSEAQFIGIIAGVAVLITLLVLALGYLLYLRRTGRQKSFNDFPSRPFTPHPVEATAETLPNPPENVQTRFYEPDSNWANSFYSQSSTTLDDEYHAGAHKVQPFAHYSADSLDGRYR